MRVRLRGTGTKPKEILAILERFFKENNISSIDNFSMYFNSKDSRQIDITMRKSEIDMNTREQEGFDSVNF